MCGDPCCLVAALASPAKRAFEATGAASAAGAALAF
jgi:hypothetical protein